MIGATAECARPSCKAEYVKKTHNQKYHNDECTKLATNENIMRKYYERKEQRSGKVRYCNTCETTKLSRYNYSNTCSACQSAVNEQRNNDISSMFANVVLV